MTKLLLIVVAVSLCACSEPLDTAPLAQPEPSHAVNAIILANPPSWHDLPQEEREARIYAALGTLHAEADDGHSFMSFTRSTASLEEKDRKAASMLERERMGEELIRQIVAASMLELHLRVSSPNLDAIARYTRTAVDTGFPGADVVAEALLLLRERWSDDAIREAAASSRDAATRWLTKTCAECIAEGAIRAGVMPAGVEDPQRDVILGVQELNALTE